MATIPRKATKRREPMVMPMVVRERAIARVAEITEALRVLIEVEGVRVTEVAAELGCGRWEIWAWRKGIYDPRSPMQSFGILEWAQYLQDRRAAWRVLGAIAHEDGGGDRCQ